MKDKFVMRNACKTKCRTSGEYTIYALLSNPEVLNMNMIISINYDGALWERYDRRSDRGDRRC